MPTALRILALATAFGCSTQLNPASERSEQWLLDASEVRAPLDVSCAKAQAGTGPFAIDIDDRTGWTTLTELHTDRVWLRSPFGVVADTCWWLPGPQEPDAIPQADCVIGRLQDGQCHATDPVGGAFQFTSPGVARAQAPILAASPLDGRLWVGTGESAQRLDLTPGEHPADDPSESRRSWLRWLDTPWPSDLPTDHLASGSRDLVLWDETTGTLHALDPAGASIADADTRTRSAPKGDGLLAAAGPWAAVAVQGSVSVYRLNDRLKRTRLRHAALDAPIESLAISSATGTVWVHMGDQVAEIPLDGEGWLYPATQLQGIVSGLPAGEPAAYAWGNLDGRGFITRLQGGVATTHTLEGPLLGLGTGQIFQELVLVEMGDSGVPTVRGALDRAHLDAMPAGTTGLAFAAFVESPRDVAFNDPQLATAVAPECATLDGLEAVCCAQGLRGDQLSRQLDWLAERAERQELALILGINPTSVAQSSVCERLGGATSQDEGSILPRAILDVADAPGVALASFLHSSPYDPASAWVRCPDNEGPDYDDSCWDSHPTDADVRAFYQDVISASSLAPWGPEPAWSLLGGGYEGSFWAGLPGWVQLYPGLTLPDGSSPGGLYFGAASMNPNTSSLAGKELAPEDRRVAAFPVSVGVDSARWDTSQGESGMTYFPGQTFALPWLYETRRSGLLFKDYAAIVSPGVDWSSPHYAGDESPERMNRADFALLEHYLFTRVLAHHDVDRPRWTYVHLQDLSRLQGLELGEGWVDCESDCEQGTELDRFLQRLERAGPALVWSPSPQGGLQ